MFERFTDQARHVLVLAQEEARMFNHNYIGTEHILLGLVREGESVAVKSLESLNVSLDAVRHRVGEIIGQGQTPPTGHIPFTPRAKKVLEFSLNESTQLGHKHIGTEHILLGLLREGEGVACQVLTRMGVNLNEVRRVVVQLLTGYQGHRTVGSTEAFSVQEAAIEVGAHRPFASDPMPVCPGCRVSLEGFLKYRILDAQESDGDGVRKVMFLFCGNCGVGIDDWMLPE